MTQNVISRSVLGNGGTILSDSVYCITGTLGQPFIGVAQSPSNANNVGFWYLASPRLITSVEQTTNNVPKEFRLEQNFPNPFNPSTTIQFALPQRSRVTVMLFDILGRQVATLVDEELETGVHKVVFDAKELANGMYFYRIRAEGFVETKKLILLK
jgi:hypothetical protein